MNEGDEFKHGDEVLVFHKDKPRQWSCQVCHFMRVQDCEAYLAEHQLPDCFTQHGYFVKKTC